MWVVLNQTKNGVSASAWRPMKSLATSSTSSSIVSIRFFVSGPGVLDPLPADAPEPRLVGVVIGVGRPRVDHAARAELLVEARELLRRRPVRGLGLLLGVEVVEVAVELVEAVRRRQVLVHVAEVVLAELPGRVAERLEQLRDRHVLGLQADVDARHPDLAQPGPEHALAGDERRPAGRAALLAVGVGEPHALVGDPVDVGRAVAHQPVAVAAQVGDADVIAPDDEDVRFAVGIGHYHSLCLMFGRRALAAGVSRPLSPHARRADLRRGVLPSRGRGRPDRAPRRHRARRAASGFQHARELGPPDLNLIEFISELGELAARGEDIRPRVFG